MLAELDQIAKDDVDWRAGRILSGLYDPGREPYELSAKVYARFLTQNAPYINMHPSAGRMEREAVRSLADLLRRRGRGRQHDHRRHREHPARGKDGSREDEEFKRPLRCINLRLTWGVWSTGPA